MSRIWTIAVITVGVVLLLVSNLHAQYTGVARCRACHLPQAKSWGETKMAQAFELLKPGVRAEVKLAKNLDPSKDYTQDANCVRCHTTGYGKPGGFESVEKTPNLAGVQCEMCHGPGSNYQKPELMSLQNKEFKRADLVAAGLIPVPDVKVCEQCHNPESPFYKPFNFEERKAQGIHQHFPLKYSHE